MVISFMFFRSQVHESEEAEHQFQQQVTFYQDELQRESEDNEILRNTLSHLEAQLNSNNKEREELAMSAAKLAETVEESESLKMEIEKLREEHHMLFKEKESLKNDLEKTQEEAKHKNEVCLLWNVTSVVTKTTYTRRRF